MSCTNTNLHGLDVSTRRMEINHELTEEKKNEQLIAYCRSLRNNICICEDRRELTTDENYCEYCGKRLK